MSGESEILDFIGNVMNEIAGGVERLRKLGVTRVLINNLHPLACTPWQTRPSNYTECMGHGNLAALFHNGDLEKKLNASSSDSVYLIDLHRAFTNIVDPSDPQDSTCCSHMKISSLILISCISTHKQ